MIIFSLVLFWFQSRLQCLQKIEKAQINKNFWQTKLSSTAFKFCWHIFVANLKRFLCSFKISKQICQIGKRKQNVINGYFFYSLFVRNNSTSFWQIFRAAFVTKLIPFDFSFCEFFSLPNWCGYLTFAFAFFPSLNRANHSVDFSLCHMRHKC